MVSGLEDTKDAVSSVNKGEDIGELKDFTDDVEELKQDAQGLYMSFVSDFKELLQKTEQGINSSPSPGIWFVSDPSNLTRHDSNDYILGDFLIALSLAVFVERHGKNIKVKDKRIKSLKMSLLKDKTLKNRLFRPAASYSRNYDSILFASLTDEMISSYSPDDMNKVFEPLLRYLQDSSRDSDVMKRDIRHELTHAYINEGTNGERDDVERAIEEACAHVVSYICGRKDLHSNYYGENGVEKQDMQTAEYAIHQKVEGMSKSEAIEKVRELGVEAVSKHRKSRTSLLSSLGIKNPDLVDSLDPENREEARKLRNSLETLQEVEYRTFHIMNLLGFLSLDEIYGHVKHLDEVINAEFYDGESKFFPDESPLGKKVIDMDLDSFMEDDSSLEDSSIDSIDTERELRSTLKEVKEGLKDLEELIQKKEINKDEKEKVKKFIHDFRELLNDYEEEEVKIDSKLGDLDEVAKTYEENTGKLYHRSNSTKSYNTVDNLENTISKTFKAYKNALNVGLNYSQDLMRLTKMLHDEETTIGKLAHEHRDDAIYDDLKRLMKLTDEIHQICSAAQQEFEKSLELISTDNNFKIN